MQGVLAGFATIALVIVVGFAMAHLRILDGAAQLMLARLSFFVASPALMIIVLGGTDVSELFSANLIASICSVAVTAALYLVVARLLWRRNASDLVIGAFSAVYVNAGNLGLPIAAYVLGDASVIAPMLLTQLVLMQPIGLTVLDLSTNRDRYSGQHSRFTRWWRIIRQPFRNPLMIGSLIGLLLSITDIQLPRLLVDPLTLIANMAVPAMLIAYGVSLRLGPLPGKGEPLVQIGYIVVLKLAVQPLVAFGVARYLLHLGPAAMLAVVVIAALPTAQNIFTHANRYQQGIVLARDSIFLSTVLSVPVIVMIAALLA